MFDTIKESHSRRKFRRGPRHWVRLRATLMGLDITGAFDRARRLVLLKRLIEKRVPGWLIEIIRSFPSSATAEPSSASPVTNRSHSG
jgi:hypothetical protein